MTNTMDTEEIGKNMLMRMSSNRILNNNNNNNNNNP
jgi:hypothetical protein